MATSNDPLLPHQQVLLGNDGEPRIDLLAYKPTAQTQALNKQEQLTRWIVRSRIAMTAIFALIYIAGIGTAMVAASVSSHHSHPADTPYSPAQDIIQFQTRQEHATDHNNYTIYFGPPSPKQEEAWIELTMPVLIRASREEMELGNENPDESVQLATTGYLASLGVYHELHCLKRIRRYLYQDKYYPNMTDEMEEYHKEHIDHCLEVLRISIMCTADTSLYTFQWRSPNDTKPATKSNAERRCVNWDSLSDWARQRAVGWNPRLLRPVDAVVETQSAR